MHSSKTAGDRLEEGEDDVKSARPLWAGLHTCYNGDHNGMQRCKSERILKNRRSSDCCLQFDNMKMESLVIADQHAAVNTYPGLVHTARHTMGIDFARSFSQKKTKRKTLFYFKKVLSLYFLLCSVTVGSVTEVKS